MSTVNPTLPTTSFIGNGDFNWWLGTVKNNDDSEAKLGRVKVCILGYHRPEESPENLPWAMVMQPTDNAASNGADGVALRGWWRPDETGTAIPSVSVGYDVMTFDPTAGFTEGYGYAVSLNWSDIFQADDTIGVSFGQPIKGTEHTDGTTKDVDPFIWELYYSFKPNDSIEVVPGVFGGSDVDTATNQDLFGAVLTTVFKF